MKVSVILQPILLCFLIFYLCSCAPSRFVKPLAKGEQAINIAAGGPIISYNDIPIPEPLVSATYGYGIDSSLTAFGSFNITSALYGNIQVEAGVVKRIVKQHHGWPGVSISPVANYIFRNSGDNKFYPQVDLNAYWDHNNSKNLFYAGLSNWFELSSTKAHDQQQDNHWLLSPMIGEYFIHSKWSINVEVKLVAANLSSQKTVVEYTTPFGHQGAMGIYVGYTRKIK